MKKIFKYPVECKDLSKLILPAGSKIISVIAQRNDIVIYAIVDPDIKEKMIFSILVAGTGNKITEDLNEYTFLGTVAFSKEVYHVFYKLDKYTG